jgi:hypothetical protein
VPTENELHTLFKNRAAIGRFNVKHSHPHVWYWSSSSDRKWVGSGQRFSDGFQNYAFTIGHSSVRLIRQERFECI